MTVERVTTKLQLGAVHYIETPHLHEKYRHDDDAWQALGWEIAITDLHPPRERLSLTEAEVEALTIALYGLQMHYPGRYYNICGEDDGLVVRVLANDDEPDFDEKNTVLQEFFVNDLVMGKSYSAALQALGLDENDPAIVRMHRAFGDFWAHRDRLGEMVVEGSA
jgi:hypothetical protein